MKREIMPISKKDFELFNAISIREFGEPLEQATAAIDNTDVENPRCKNCGKQWNGHFLINDTFCPRCGAYLINKPFKARKDIEEADGR